MKAFNLISATLALPIARAYLVSPPGTPAPGATQECSDWVQQAYSVDCKKIVQFYGMTEAQFVAWNPSVTMMGPGCNLISGLYYCVQVNYVSMSFLSTGPPTSTTSSTSLTPIAVTTTTAGNGITTPIPTQSGMTNNCKSFYKVQSGDNCQAIVDKYGTFTLADFTQWNPAVGSDCRSLWVDYYVCVGIPGTPTSKPPPSGPSPTQAGIVKSCNNYYKAQSGDTCQTIIDKYRSFTLNDFYTWNPAVKSDCSGLWSGYYYCVGIPMAFHARALYHADCTGTLYNEATIADNSDGLCLDTNCQVASLDTAAAGSCPDGQVQISYWEQPGCTGKWFGYGYTTRNTCHKLWTEGWKFKSLHLRCAKEQDDCVSKKTCTYDPEPAQGICQ